LVSLRLVIEEFIYVWQFYVELIKLLVNGELFDPEQLFSIVGSILPFVIFSSQTPEAEQFFQVSYEKDSYFIVTPFHESGKINWVFDETFPKVFENPLLNDVIKYHSSF